MQFARAAWRVVEPQTTFEVNWHHELVMEHLMLAFRGELRRLIINMPPQHTKSRLVTVIWPAWGWTQRPGSAWINAGYSHDLSVLKHSADRRKIILSDWYRERWGHVVEIAAGQNRQDEYQNSKGGVMVATSTGGTITGKGGDFLIVDDLLNPLQAVSDAERERANNYFDQTLWTRQRDPRTSVFVVVMQRLHSADLVGHILEEKSELPWTVLELPTEAKGKTTITFPISGRVVTRQPDELLWPSRFTPKVIADYKRILGSWAYAGQMQQSPTPMGGGIWKRAWWHFWGGPCPRCGGTVHGLPGAFDDVLQSWDLSFKETEGADYVAGHVWARRGADAFFLDRVNDRLDFPGTIVAVEALTGKWPMAMLKLVEDKANGPAVIATLRHRIPGLVEVDPAGGKVARAHSVSPVIEAGNAYIPHPSKASWVHDFLEQASAFPRGAHDDDVDAASQALRRLAGFGLPGEGFMQYLGQQAAAQEKTKGTVRTILKPGAR